MDVAIKNYQHHGSVCYQQPSPDTYTRRYIQGLAKVSHDIDCWHTEFSCAVQLSIITGISTHTSSLPHWCQYVYFVWHAQPPVGQCVLHYLEIALIEHWVCHKVDEGMQVYWHKSLGDSLLQHVTRASFEHECPVAINTNNEKTRWLRHLSRGLWQKPHASPHCSEILPLLTSADQIA